MKDLSQKSYLTTDTYEALRDAILDGELKPNQTLAQNALAERLGVSRQPVALALAALKRDGLVVECGRKSLTVAPLEYPRLRDCYQVRGAIDGLAASLAAKRAASGEVDVEAVLLPRLAAGETAYQANDLTALIRADISFHNAIFALSGNQELARAAAPLWPLLRRGASAARLAQVDEHELSPWAVWRRHAQVTDAIHAGDAASAQAEAEAHCYIDGINMVEWLEDLLGDPAPDQKL